jgi:hypothetical protein
MLDITIERIRCSAPLLRSVAVLSLLLGSSGCLFLSPDDPEAGLRIEMIARVDDSGALGRAAVDPAVVLASEGLTARAQLFRTAPESETVVPVTSVPLLVGPLVDGERTVSGLLEFNAGPVGSTYRLVAELLYLGLDAPAPDTLNPAGDWFGEIAFEAGSLNVQVPSLTFTPAATANTFTGQIRLTHPSLNAQQIPTVNLTGVVFEPATGRVTMSYVAPELVQWDESTEELEVIEVRFEGRFAPVVAFSGEQAFDLAPVSEVVTLELTSAEHEPIEIGQRIDGSLRVSVHENDGTNGPGATILSESGSVSIFRVQPSRR